MFFSHLVYCTSYLHNLFCHYSAVHLRRRRRLPLRPGGGRQQRREQALLLRVRLQPVQDLLPGAAATAAAAGVSSGDASAALLNSRGACLSEERACYAAIEVAKCQKTDETRVSKYEKQQGFLSVVAVFGVILIRRSCIVFPSFSLLPSV